MKRYFSIILLPFFIFSLENINFPNDEQVSAVSDVSKTDQIAIPLLLNYQGKLTDPIGNPVRDSTYSITFRLFTTPTGGNAFWTETQTIQTRGGLFHTLLGSVNPITSLPLDGNCYLEMQVNPNPPMSPRIRIVSSAYSYIAKRADTASYAQNAPLQRPITPPISTNEISDNAVTSAKIQDGTIVGADLNQMGASSGQVLKWTGTTWAPGNDEVGGDNAWVRIGSDSVLYTKNQLGISRGGSNNMLYGDFKYTHINLGVACTTGVTGFNIRYCTVNGGYGNKASGDYATVGGGWSNTASSNNATVGGGWSNTASNGFATVGGGEYNTASSGGATVGGGGFNMASGVFATVAGGYGDTASRVYATVGGGYRNTASGSFAMVGGGYWNTASGYYATVGGGYRNTASNYYATVAGGDSNVAMGNYATVGGGYYNRAESSYATVAGGYGDTASGPYAMVGGGYWNTASDSFATVGGGRSNRASGRMATVGGGYGNKASGNRATVGGGDFNMASGVCATVAGGYGDTASALYATVGGGAGNMASGLCATVAGGYSNIASGGECATVGGGKSNTASSSGATVGGGGFNMASGYAATVGGGCNNKASGDCATVAGGYGDTASGYYATVGGGRNNTASGNYATVSGGYWNMASDSFATVGGGYYNTANRFCATVAGGDSNGASGNYATVSGGRRNTASALYATVGGGYYNRAESLYATVGGGWSNTASSKNATVGGGLYNTASAYAATVAGGYGNISAGYCSFTTNRYSVVPASYSNSAAFNGQTATASNQLRCGTLSQGGGAFTIDHPLDPYNKILNHYFVEGPEMLNIYRGSVVLNANGRAEVKLPDYFSALNRNPHIQLTGVGTSDVYVLEDVKDNRFVIGGKPGTKVYWLVTGERADVSAEVIRRLMPVEQEKKGALRGCMLDDDFLSGCMEQLEREGKANGINFRTAEGRKRYEDMKRAPKELEREIKK